MLNSWFNLPDGSAASIILSVSLMLFLGYLATRLTRLIGLPNVTAYITIGVLMGPYFLDLVPKSVIQGTDFLADIALSLISFCIGEYFVFSSFKKNGLKALLIAFLESMAATLIVFVLTYFVLKLSFAFSLVVSALAAVTSPTSTMMTIKQTKAKGDFVDTLLQVIALDNLIGLFSFSIAVSVAASLVANADAEMLAQSVLMPIVKNLLMILLGCVMGYLIKILIPPGKRAEDNRLIVTMSVLLMLCGVCVLINVSPLLGCLAMGTIYRNTTGDDTLFMQLNYFSPPILLLFFVRSGMNFNLGALVSKGGADIGVPLIVISLVYFAARMAGKYAGCFTGALVTKKVPKTRNYLGFALIPQAGVAIGLAALCSRTLGGELGENIQTVIVSAGIMYEMIGPVLAKVSLFKSGSYADTLEKAVLTDHSVDKDGKPKSNIEILAEQLKQIHDEFSKERLSNAENEKAFTEAAVEQQFEESFENITRGRFLNRR